MGTGIGLAQVRKAIAAAVVAAAVVLVKAASQGGNLDTNDYISAGVAGLVAGVSVFFIPNAAVTPKAA